MNTNSRDLETFAIIGAAMEVHRVLGKGFVEAVYQEALAVEFGEREMQFQREVALPVQYKGTMLSTSYRADFVCLGAIIVELKASHALLSVDQAQVLNYLNATGYARGVLLNFGTPSLQYHRLYLSPTRGYSELENV
jgi:GxxExxY protein